MGSAGPRDEGLPRCYGGGRGGGFEGASLSRVYRLYRGLGVRHLPVINTDNVVVGILSRKELRTDWKGDSLI